MAKKQLMGRHRGQFPLLLVIVSLAALSVGVPAQTGTAFPLSCELPFKAIQENHPIDESCGLEGKSTGSDAQHAQNRMKNNFCATGDPITVTFDDLINLQKTAKAKGITFGGDDKLPTDRSLLVNLITGSSGKKSDTTRKAGGLMSGVA